ncbi:MAG TPA: nicotinate-nucleotide adenylyltransferase [Methylophilaceae bacterium]|nr:nicotinate-nucleotide adenylyltransferase [Methylophilaceae bacterium]
MHAIGILGGTFDPIHFGHLRMAEELREKIGLERIRFIPAAIPPHRASPQIEAFHRAEMVRLAIAGNPAFTLDNRELARSGPSYTFDTLNELRAELGADTPLCLLIGSDVYLGLHTWHRWRELLDLAHLVVAHRPGTTPKEDSMSPELRQLWQQRGTLQPADVQVTPAGRILLLPITALDISASAIRTAFMEGRSTRYLIPETVRTYIESHHLYARQASKEHHGT